MTKKGKQYEKRYNSLNKQFEKNKKIMNGRK